MTTPMKTHEVFAAVSRITDPRLVKTCREMADFLRGFDPTLAPALDAYLALLDDCVADLATVATLKAAVPRYLRVSVTVGHLALTARAVVSARKTDEVLRAKYTYRSTCPSVAPDRQALARTRLAALKPVDTTAYETARESFLLSLRPE